jgi:hypothetical protein
MHDRMTKEITKGRELEEYKMAKVSNTFREIASGEFLKSLEHDSVRLKKEIEQVSMKLDDHSTSSAVIKEKTKDVLEEIDDRKRRDVDEDELYSELESVMEVNEILHEEMDALFTQFRAMSAGKVPPASKE